jgi:fatty-acyl-CoA synthase
LPVESDGLAGRGSGGIELFIPIDGVSYHARRQPGAPACVDLETGRRWTYAELNADVDRVAAWVATRVGLASGARIACLARNSVAMLILHLAVVRAGAVFVPLNWRLTASELEKLLADAGATLLFYDTEFARPPFGGVSLEMAELERIEPRSSGVTHSARGVDQPSTLLYTSGTSGHPKGVIVTESNAYWGCTNFILGNGFTGASVMLCDMPMFHVAGLFAAVRSALLAGGSVLISRGFEAQRTLARIADPLLRVSHYFSVPQMAQILWDQDNFQPDMLRHLAVYATGGAPNPRAQVERFVRAGIRMSDGFGMSETSSNFGMPVYDPELLLAKAGSCGLPYIAVQARLVDATGSDVPVDQVGELWLRGPSITPGYWNQPELTRAAFDNGWFKTGDAAVRDADGFYYIVDRRKDMYISGGENVYPAEIEAVLCELPGIREAAVIGVPDERWGEVGRAYVVTSPGCALDEETILIHCRQRLAGYKLPRMIVFSTDIPRTASGKILKTELRRRAE